MCTRACALRGREGLCLCGCEQSRWHTSRFFKSKYLSTTKGQEFFLTENDAHHLNSGSSWFTLGSDFNGNPPPSHPRWINMSQVTNGTVYHKIYGLEKGMAWVFQPCVELRGARTQQCIRPWDSHLVFRLSERILTALNQDATILRPEQASNAKLCPTDKVWKHQ